MQETNLSIGLATDDMTPDAASPPEAASIEDALREELAKWQERVPKLAAALRERTNEVNELRAELSSASAPSTADRSGNHSGLRSSGIEARDALIEELEAKVQALSGKHQDAEGQLHARDLEITQLRAEAGEWREKWQAVTSSLDEQADNAGEKDRASARLRGELDEMLAAQERNNGRIKEQDLELATLRERSQSLESRNQNLFETTELANRQIETLGENLGHLRAELKASRQALAGKDEEVGGSEKQIEDLKAQIGSRDQDIEFLHGHVEEKQKEITALAEQLAESGKQSEVVAELNREQERLNRLLQERDNEVESLGAQVADLNAARQTLADAEQKLSGVSGELDSSRQEAEQVRSALEAAEQAQESQKQEVLRLEECVAKAEEATSRFEAERRQMSEQLDELKKRNEHLEDQLSERSDLVVGLEQEKSAITDQTSSLKSENKRLSEALEKAQQAAAGNADYIAQVDARLERQKQLMENLEEEFAEVQDEHARALKTHQREMNEKIGENATLHERVDEDSVATLTGQLSELEEQLAEITETLAERDAALSSSEENCRTQQQTVENLRHELDGKSSEERAASERLQTRVKGLEQQLRKQFRATAEAEEVHARTQQALEEQKAAVSRVPDEVTGENSFLQAEVVKLEGMVRERTEQLNKLRWQQDMLEKQSAEGVGDGSDNKMLVVLNQQLVVTREENERLKEKLRELETRPDQAPQATVANVVVQTATAADDLALIKGIGPKLVKKLTGLGISRFDQIATLSDADLDDTGHPLHSMRGRVLKDNWIAQAAVLGGEQD